MRIHTLFSIVILPAMLAGCATTTNVRKTDWSLGEEHVHQIPLSSPTMRQQSAQWPVQEAAPAPAPEVVTPDPFEEIIARAKAKLAAQSSKPMTLEEAMKLNGIKPAAPSGETVTEALRAEGMKPVAPSLSLPPLGQPLLQQPRLLYPPNVHVGEVYNSGNIPAKVHTDLNLQGLSVDSGSSVSVGNSSF